MTPTPASSDTARASFYHHHHHHHVINIIFSRGSAYNVVSIVVYCSRLSSNKFYLQYCLLLLLLLLLCRFALLAELIQCLICVFRWGCFDWSCNLSPWSGRLELSSFLVHTHSDILGNCRSSVVLYTVGV